MEAGHLGQHGPAVPASVHKSAVPHSVHKPGAEHVITHLPAMADIFVLVLTMTRASAVILV